MLRYYHWCGITRSDRLYEKYANEQIDLFENAILSRWDNVLEFLFNNKDVNDFFG